MTHEQRELLREHKMHSLLTLKQAKTLASQLEFDFERRDLDISDTYYPKYDECIILKQDDQEVIVLGGRDVSYFGSYRRLFEIIEKHI
ncbi:hypothetical protein [Sphingobacterium sp. BIGb0116]|uniref:hypothetical protein n=1 Tax=Sphingobacterium sp. BIGb0116 TaxID=2940619 RepID=UPI0021687215|nr:hypothetical protein [Sphingobacterium sp. BIGb0116]MCS4164434.1 hypothetical protein [Sphingobacterium sp. BIGb0116]